MQTKVPELAFIRCPTPQLEAIIERYRGSRSSEQFVALMNFVRQRFTKYSEILSLYPAGPDRAEATHRLVDDAFAESSGIRATCGRGCAACCHLEVEVTADEGALLARRVADGIDVDRARLAQQASRDRKTLAWKPLLQETNRCVFLGDDNACRIYESRPSICRKHVVSSPPSECSLEDGHPESIPIPLAEIVVSAALSQEDNAYTSLSKALLSRLGDSGEVTAVPKP